MQERVGTQQVHLLLWNQSKTRRPPPFDRKIFFSMDVRVVLLSTLSRYSTRLNDLRSYQGSRRVAKKTEDESPPFNFSALCSTTPLTIDENVVLETHGFLIPPPSPVRVRNKTTTPLVQRILLFPCLVVRVLGSLARSHWLKLEVRLALSPVFS